MFLSDAVFSEVSDFIEGYGKVSTQSKSLFFSYDSKCYKNDTLIEDIPKINTIRSNPDLIPFEMLDKYGDFDIFDGLMGYKNQNGEVIIPAKYKSAYPFVNGFAKVVISKKIISHTYFKFGLIDSEGNFVLPCDFTEIGDVYNDVVWYKKSIIKSDYVDVSGAACNYNMQEVSTKYIRYGYLIYKELRPAIYNEIEEIFKTEADIKNLKTNGEVDNAYETIRETKKKIDLYLQTVLSAYTK